MKIKISNKYVGDNYPVFVIAEGGINHNGNVKLAKQLISEAKHVGADAVKFQTFKASDLASVKSKYYNIFKNLELSSAEFAELSDYSRSEDIIFLSTPFSNDAVDLLYKLSVPAFKIASGDITNIPLIKHAASKGRPVIISTGMSNIKEVELAVKAVLSVRNKKIILLHSVSSYPAPPSETNLKVILEIKERFHSPVGFSDNGDDLLVPLVAVAVGAQVIEKHFTLNRKLSGPDHKLSAEPTQFRELVKNIRKLEAMLGDGQKRCQLSESDNLLSTRRSVTARITIDKGTKIEPHMLAIKRPGAGISPVDFMKVVGKVTSRRILLDEVIKWKDLK